MLGEQIRKLRKQKKITLEALAGDELTKGMLSLIENNKANPSMESLNYIAERLGVEVSELLGGINTNELREILEQAEKMFNDENFDDKYKQLVALIEPVIEKLSAGYESARLLEIYGRSLFRDKKDGWRQYVDRAAIIYDDMNLTARRASIGIFRSNVEFLKHHYQQALEIFLKERTEIEANHAFTDPMTRLDLEYNEAVFYFAVGNSEAATCAMERGITFSKKHRILYRIDDLYRLAAAQALMTHDEETKEHYLMKLRQFGEFADDVLSMIFYENLQIMSLINEKHDYIQAIERIDQYLSDPKMPDIFQSSFLLEKGRALYGLKQYQDALKNLELVRVPNYAHHPFDLATFYIVDSYKALCQLELGIKVEALKNAQKAVENFNPLPPSPFKVFALETLSKLEKLV